MTVTHKQFANAVSGTEGAALKDLTDEEFRERYDCDRFTASLLATRLQYIISRMTTKVRSNAFSPIIRDSVDFCVTISGGPAGGYALPAVSQTMPVHWGPAPDAVRVICEEIGPDRMRPGDVIICNDGYRSGKHPNDMTFIRPVFSDDVLVGVVHITAHQIDIGSKVPGGFDLLVSTMWEDGLIVPPLHLYRGGEPDLSTFHLMAVNTRWLGSVLPDLAVICSALRMGESEVLETIEKYGVDAYEGSIRHTCDASSESMRLALTRLPDGTYHGASTIDGNGHPDSPEYEVRVAVHKHGDRLEFDFSGTSEQSGTAINAAWPDVRTGVLLALKVLFDPTSRATSATLRGMDIVMPYRSLVNPEPPASTQYYFSIVTRVYIAVWEALNSALGADAKAPLATALQVHRGEGRTEKGDAWAMFVGDSLLVDAAWGATRHGDGDSHQLQLEQNLEDPGVEIKEILSPIVTLRSESVPDTAGPGYHRGGCSSDYEVYFVHPGTHVVTGSNMRSPMNGVWGGGPGAPGGSWLYHAEDAATMVALREGTDRAAAEPVSGLVDETTHEIDQVGGVYQAPREIVSGSGAVWRRRSCGAGGWGDPFEREAERVLVDVRDGFISAAAAERDYGVVVTGDPDLDPEGLRVDVAATSAARAAAGRPVGGSPTN